MADDHADDLAAGDRTETVIIAACGHEVVLPPDDGSPAHARKTARALARGCEACRAAAHEERNRREQEAAAARKAEKWNVRYPAGTLIAIKRLDDGTWTGTLDALGRSAVFRGVSLALVLRGLVEQSAAWFEAGYVAGPVPIILPGAGPRPASKSVIDVRGPRRRLAAGTARRILDAAEQRRDSEAV